jgi:protein required for attachment to host cells
MRGIDADQYRRENHLAAFKRIARFYMKRKIVWALVADSSRARLFRDIHSPGAVEETKIAAEHKSLGEIMADRPGRSISSTSPRRSAMEYHSDPVRDRERAFAALLARKLEAHRAKGEIDGLILIAAPQTLGDLREVLSPKLKAITAAEIDKDLTKLPKLELLRRLGELG